MDTNLHFIRFTREWFEDFPRLGRKLGYVGDIEQIPQGATLASLELDHATGTVLATFKANIADTEG